MKNIYNGLWGYIKIDDDGNTEIRNNFGVMIKIDGNTGTIIIEGPRKFDTFSKPSIRIEPLNKDKMFLITIFHCKQKLCLFRKGIKKIIMGK